MKQRKNESLEAFKIRQRDKARLWRARNHDRFLETCRKRYIKNHDKIIESRSKWREKNRDTYNASIRDYNKTEKRRTYIREYRRNEYRTNPIAREKIKARSVRYRKNHPTFSQKHKAIRKARLRNQMPSDADLKLISMFYDIARRVSQCLGVEHHVDHIFPISKGGFHHQNNLQVLSAVLNQRKNNKIIAVDFAA